MSITDKIQIPAPVYVRPEDYINFRVWNSASGVRCSWSGRFITLEGILIPLFGELTPSTDRTENYQYYQIGEGWLISVQTGIEAGAPRRGQTFVQLEIRRGRAGGKDHLTLCSNYIYLSGRETLWPDGKYDSSISGAGILRTILGTNPTPGNDITESCPTNARWRLYYIWFSLTTSSVTGNRHVILLLDDGANDLVKLYAGDVQAAGITRNYCVAHFGVDRTAVGDTIQINLPREVFLFQGWRFRTYIDGRDAGDDLSAPRFIVEEWIED